MRHALVAVVGVAVVLLAIAAAAWLAAAPEPGDADRVERAVRPPGTGISTASIVLRHRGRKQAEIAAEHVEVSVDGRTTVFSGLPTVVVFEGDAPGLTATGGRIVFDRRTQDVRVEGGLRITTVRGETLTARAASWDHEKQVMDLTGPVALLAAPGGAQTTAPSPSASPSGSSAGAAAPAAGQGRLRADRIRYFARDRVYVATGNVSLTMGDLQIRADALRLEQGPQVATAEGRVIVLRREMQLTAPVLRYELRTETAEATGGVVLVQKGTTVRAPRMRFILQEDVAIASGGVEVTSDDATMTAPVVRHDARTGDVTAEGGVRLTRPGSTMTGRRLLANLAARRADMREDVTLVRAPAAPPSPTDRVGTALVGEETTVTAARIVFRWDVNEGEATENVIVRQREKTAWADRMTYSEPSNQLVLTGRVTLEQLSGEWLLREGLISPPRTTDERQGLASVTRLTCSRLVMALRERDIVAEGPLRVTQKDRVATGDRGTYTEATRRLVVTGNVRMQEADGRRLQADRVVISLIEETFEAEGNVETQFVIRPSPTRHP